MKEHDHGESFLFYNASRMEIWVELNMLWIRKFKLIEMDVWIVQSKHAVECKNLKRVTTHKF
jgi:hypothetical protein